MNRLRKPFWRTVRWTYRLGLAAVLWVVGFHIGPNVINYGRLAPPDPSAFTGIVNARCVPVLRAMAAYRRDMGWDAFPTVEALVPKYLPTKPSFPIWQKPDGSVIFPMFSELRRVRYTFQNGVGVWTIEGPNLDGVVPAERVPEYLPPPDAVGH